MMQSVSTSEIRSLDAERRLRKRLATCMACGRRMAPCLVRAASPRCHDCRDSRAPLRADLFEGRLAA